MAFGFGPGLLPDLGSQLRAMASQPQPSAAPLDLSMGEQKPLFTPADAGSALGKLGISLPGQSPSGPASDLNTVKTGLGAGAASNAAPGEAASALGGGSGWASILDAIGAFL